MFTFFKTIFSAIASATVSLVASLGLISAPAQLSADVKTEPVPIVQQQMIDNKIKPTSENEQPKSTKPAATDVGRSQSAIIPTPVPIKIQTTLPTPAPVIAPTPAPAPAPTVIQVPQSTISVNTPSISPTQTQIEITSVKVTPSLKSANFEWDTNIPVNAKVFVSGSDISTIVSQSNSGISTHHVATVSSLQANKSYDFKIDAISTEMLVKTYTGSFKTTSMASMKIFQTGGGIQGEYTANNYKINPDGTLAAGSTEPNDSNYINLGLIVRDDSGQAVKDAVVTIEAKDLPDPNCWVCRRVINGTGSVRKIYNEDGVRELTSYYDFHYDFITPGQHTIIFSANGMSESITLDVK